MKQTLAAPQSERQTGLEPRSGKTRQMVV